MALTPLRAALGVLVLCAAVAAAYLPLKARERPPSRRTPQREAAADARRQVYRAHAALVLARRTDSIRQRLPAAPDRPFIVYGTEVDAQTRTWHRQRTDALWDSMGVESPVLPVGVYITLDTLIDREITGLRSWESPIDYLLPAALDGRACVSVITLGPRSRWTRDTGGRRPPRRSWDALLGPCAFYGAYGIPGAAIAAWIESSSGFFALNTATADTARAGRAAEVLDFRRYGYTSARYRSEVLSREGCLVGRLSRCREVLGDGTPGWAELFTSLPPSGGALAPGSFAPGQEMAWLLWDVLREFGPERFRAFWTSGESLDRAFSAAFRVSPAQYLRDWHRTRYGSPPGGFRVGAGSILISLLVVLGLVGAAMAHATYRSVA